MSIGFKEISGLTQAESNDGLPISSIPGDSGGPINAVVITALGYGLSPLDGAIGITLYPNGAKFASGTDSSGNISVSGTLINSGDDINFILVGVGSIALTDGFWNQLVRGPVNSLLGTRGFQIQFNTKEPGDFTPTLIDTPDNLAASDTSWDADEEKGNTTLSFSYDNSSAENPVGFVIVRDDGSSGPIFVGTLPWTNGVTDYSYIDYVFAEGSYTYTIKAYKYSPDLISPASGSVVVAFGGSQPDISITGSGGITFGGSATVVLIADPSGIYTLVPGKLHDTLYTHGSPESVDVKIPDPTFKTAYTGE